MALPCSRSLPSGMLSCWPIRVISGAIRRTSCRSSIEYPAIQLILAHLGNSDDGSISRQVEAIERASNGNLWVDTSSSRSMFSGLIEWAVDRIGHDRILFGSDTPLYWAGAQKGRIETAEIDETAKQAILWDNAASLLGLER